MCLNFRRNLLRKYVNEVVFGLCVSFHSLSQSCSESMTSLLRGMKVLSLACVDIRVLFKVPVGAGYATQVSHAWVDHLHSSARVLASGIPIFGFSFLLGRNGKVFDLLPVRLNVCLTVLLQFIVSRTVHSVVPGLNKVIVFIVNFNTSHVNHYLLNFRNPHVQEVPPAIKTNHISGLNDK